VIAEAEAARTNPGSELMVEVLKLAGPSVILLDELVAYARQLLGCCYFEDELVGASGAACCSGGLDPASMECVAVVLSSSARAQTHARLTRKARVRADSTLVLSTKDISLHMPLKKETSLPCSGSQSPIA
jgi:hypothetical protein